MARMQARPLPQARRSLGRWHLAPRVALLALLGFGALQAAAPSLRLRGEVRDAQTGRPLAGALARADSETALTGPNGLFQLGPVPPWQTVSFEADGYEPRSAPAWLPGATSAALPPLAAEAWTVDEDSGQPVAASLESDFGRVEGLEPGRFRLAPIKAGSRLSARAEGYLPTSAVYDGETNFALRLTPVPVGRVLDAVSGRPVAGAQVLADEQLISSDADGRFELPGRPRRTVRVTAPGFRRLEVDGNAAGSLELRLEPFTVRGLYLAFYGSADESVRGNALRLLETTEANTLVVDVKGDRGLLAYESRVPLAGRIGANKRPTLPDVDRFLAALHANGRYAIARIVIFKDDLLARNGAAAGLDVAIKDRRTGRAWVDGEGLGWVDPFRAEVWDYNVALAREAAERGFDEVQFDYVRFPTDPGTSTSVDAATYSREPTAQSRPEAIASFLERAHQAIRPLGAFLSVDTFGYTCWRDDDLGIGQNLAAIAPHVDYISPMIYPSTYHAGLPGTVSYPAVIDRPYDVVYESLDQARVRMAGRGGARLRPWLQYFDDYAWATGRSYDAAQIQAQKAAADDAGGVGWMLWDPFSRYARGGLNPQ